MIEKEIPITMEIHHTSIFMHDGAPCHWSKIVGKQFKDNKISVLDWPGLNPIKNMWMIIKNKVGCQDTDSLPKLQKAITKVWCTDLLKKYCENLIKSMPKRLGKVIDNIGQMTIY